MEYNSMGHPLSYNHVPQPTLLVENNDAKANRKKTKERKELKDCNNNNKNKHNNKN